MKPTKEKIKSWLKRFGHSREWLGEQCGGVSKNTVNNWLSTSISIPDSSLYLIGRLMEDDERAEAERLKSDSSVPQSHLVIQVDVEEFNAWERIAIQQTPPQTVTDWALQAIKDAFAAEQKISKTVTNMPAKPHILAAAGSPITAEVMDWNGLDDTVMVRISGLSMVPLLNDGDVVPMKLKKVSRNPFMKKGLIYLVEYDGGYTVKRYNTRPAKPDEKGEEWVENGRVKVLESLNPDYSEIIIKQPLEWIAWLDQ